jgi:hypothetical protein
VPDFSQRGVYPIDGAQGAGPCLDRDKWRLPTGVTLSSTGLLDGAPTTTGQFNLGITLSMARTVNKGEFYVSAVNISSPGACCRTQRRTFSTPRRSQPPAARAPHVHRERAAELVEPRRRRPFRNAEFRQYGPGKFSVNVTAKDLNNVCPTPVDIDRPPSAGRRPSCDRSQARSIRTARWGNRAIGDLCSERRQAPFSWSRQRAAARHGLPVRQRHDLSQVTPGDVELYGARRLPQAPTP